MLNPNEQMHKDLIAQVRLMVQALQGQRNAQNAEQFSGAHTLARQTGRSILKAEWNRVKTGEA